MKKKEVVTCGFFHQRKTHKLSPVWLLFWPAMWWELGSEREDHCVESGWESSSSRCNVKEEEKRTLTHNISPTFCSLARREERIDLTDEHLAWDALWEHDGDTHDHYLRGHPVHWWGSWLVCVDYYLKESHLPISNLNWRNLIIGLDWQPINNNCDLHWFARLLLESKIFVMSGFRCCFLLLLLPIDLYLLFFSSSLSVPLHSKSTHINW